MMLAQHTVDSLVRSSTGVSGLRSAIESGRLHTGVPLATQAELAAEHGVALATLHQALRALDQTLHRPTARRWHVRRRPPPPTPESVTRSCALSLQSFSSSRSAVDAALALLAEQVGVGSAFLSRVAQHELAIVADYDRGGCGISRRRRLSA
jgi:DNA-binding transcriptional MocR family regulator